MFSDVPLMSSGPFKPAVQTATLVGSSSGCEICACTRAARLGHVLAEGQ